MGNLWLATRLVLVATWYPKPSVRPLLVSLKTGRCLFWRFLPMTLLSEDMTISAIPHSVQFHPAMPASCRSATDDSEMKVKLMAILLDLWSIASVTNKQNLELKAQSSKPHSRSTERKKKRSWAIALKITPADHNYSVKAQLCRDHCGCTHLKKGKEVKWILAESEAWLELCWL